MAQDSKYGQIEIPGIPDDEPVFIIRAKDCVACDAILDYAEEAFEKGASMEFVTSVRERVREIEEWQTSNKDAVKVPD